MVSTMLLPMLDVLYFYVSTFRVMCAVLNMAVFCNFFTSCSTGMLPRYFLNYFDMVPGDTAITGIIFVFYIPYPLIIIIIRYGCLLSQAFSSWYFS